jgi:DtxR family Mn-dependent transcriptional regulator
VSFRAPSSVVRVDAPPYAGYLRRMFNRALSRSVEDYLKAIYGLSDGGAAASTSAIAELLDIQPASVTGMVKRMAESGLLEHVPYKGVRLTDSGSREALRVLRRHRVLETYLCEKLGFPWDDVHEEAERLEHAASDQLIEQMAQALGFPSHDPHGAPIPSPSGDIEVTDVTTLAEARAGEKVRIRAVRDEDPAALRSMASVGLVPGAKLLIRPRAASPGTVEVSVGGDEHHVQSIRDELARHIFVVPDVG